MRRGSRDGRESMFDGVEKMVVVGDGKKMKNG